MLAAGAAAAQAQSPTGSFLRFDVENSTTYDFDCPFSDLGTNPNNLGHPNTTVGIRSGLGIADIVSVNGNPAKGTALQLFSARFGGSPNPAPGRPITDGTRGGIAQWDLDFLNLDGTQIGTIHIDGFIGGNSAPGAPKDMPTGGGYTVTGGSGAFLGVRGYFETTPYINGARFTSACEDPSLRRVYAGTLGRRTGVLYLIPLSQPKVLTTPNGPAVVHADRTLVTTASPAKAGETLTLFATGLGPTRPGVDPGQPFTRDPLQAVNSPVQVLVNGNAVNALYAAGFPGTTDEYWVDFQIPSGTAGQTSIQVSSAWMAGPVVIIPVQ
jgi:hypothetical protein